MQCGKIQRGLCPLNLTRKFNKANSAAKCNPPPQAWKHRQRINKIPLRGRHACRAHLLPITTWTPQNRLFFTTCLLKGEKHFFFLTNNVSTMEEPPSQPSGSGNPNNESNQTDYPVNASSSDDSISTHVGSSAGPSDEISNKHDLSSDVTGPPKPAKPKRRAGKGSV